MNKQHQETPIIEMKDITKRFPGVTANNQIELRVYPGKIHALLGENGAGKTTLMNILYGLLQPDEGEIYIRGHKVNFKSPKDAINQGIGMVHQHFMLIPSLTVTENVILGLKGSKGLFINPDQAKVRIEGLMERYGLKVDPLAKIWQLSVGERQRVEIIKILYRGVDVLILDEPTSVLTPQEVKELFIALRSLAQEKRSIIFITHKLYEVMEISDQIVVLRRGKVVSVTEPYCTNEKDLAKMMVGREIFFRSAKSRIKKGSVVLQVRNLRALSDRGFEALKDVSFEVYEGEILGIAGVAGNGQKELSEAITGFRKAQGEVFIRGQDITNSSPRKMREQKVGYIPEERLSRGLIMDFTVAENAILGSHLSPPFTNRWFLDFEEIEQYTKNLISEYNIKTLGTDIPTRHLSGGNLQRLILARELSRGPQLLIASQPTRGLDVGATEYIRNKLLEEREKGTAILLISEDLDEIMSLSDRIAIISNGKIVSIVPRDEADKEKIGLMMTGR